MCSLNDITCHVKNKNDNGNKYDFMTGIILNTYNDKMKKDKLYVFIQYTFYNIFNIIFVMHSYLFKFL